MFSPHGMSHKDQEVLGCWGHRAASRGLYFFSVFSGFSVFFCKPGDILGRLQGMLLKALRGCRERCWLGRCFLEMLLGSAWSEHTPQLMSWNKGWKKICHQKKVHPACVFTKGSSEAGRGTIFLSVMLLKVTGFQLNLLGKYLIHQLAIGTPWAGLSAGRLSLTEKAGCFGRLTPGPIIAFVEPINK